MKIAFIGGGNMAQAMLAAILKAGIATPGAVSVSDIDPARLKQLQREFGVHTTGSNLEAVARGDVVVLAVKPQNLDEVLAELKGKLKPAQLVLSIVAGKGLDSLRQGISHSSIVRAMPNTPARIGQGMTVWTATGEVTGPQKSRAGAILGAMGSEVFVADEGFIDMATAVSGSGPAYLFLFMESLVDAARSIGLPPDMARQLVLQTVIGSGNFARGSGEELGQLRKMVTSPGGTTAAALKVFEQGRFAELVKQAVAAAYKRAQQLGG
jgi:pyrroline-5-carboxylate reductase